MDSQCDAQDMLKEQLTTINPEVIYDPYQDQQNGYKLFNGYRQDVTTVKEELSVNKSAIDIQGNASRTTGDIHRSNAEECTHLQYDLNRERTKIKPEPLSDQSHPCISALRDKASDGTAYEGETTMCKSTVDINHDNLFVADNIQWPQSEELDHKSCSILMSFEEEYFDTMPVLNIKQENAVVRQSDDVTPAISNDNMANVAIEISPPILDPHQIKIENNDSQVLIMESQSSNNITICVSEKPHLCQQCDERFSSAERLEENMMTRGENPYSCSQSEKRFTHSGDLKKHIVTHAGEMPHSCPQCNKGFSCSSYLKRHMMSHAGEKLHICPQCKKGFIRSSEIKRHMMLHTGIKPHLCPQCNKSFTRAGSLRLHVMTHTGEKPHSCSQCNKSFTQAGDLRQHMRIHTGEKPHSCPQCNKGFTCTSKLKRHMMIHTGERPHSCPL